MKRCDILVALGILAAMTAAPARAQDPADAANTSTTISLAGQVVMRIRTGAAGYTAEQRADAVRTRLTPILSMQGLTAHDVTVQTLSPHQSNILVRGHLLLTVDQTLAHANGQRPTQLAQAWAASLRETIPQVTAAHGSQYETGHL